MPLIGTIRPHPHERIRELETFSAPGGGADIVATLAGLHRSYQVSGTVYVETADPAGVGWALNRVTVASDADSDAVPTLAVDRWERIYLWYHTASGLKGYRSDNYGASFAAWGATTAGLTFPRTFFALDEAYLVAHNGASLVVYKSADFLATLTSVLTVTAPEQLADLGLDRRGRRYLIYTDGTDIKQRASADGVTWETATTLRAARTKPSAAYNLPWGVHLHWDGATLESRVTGSDYQSLEAGTGTAAVTFAAQYTGLTVDRRGRGWITGVVSGDTLQTLHTLDGLNWTSL